MSNFVCCSVQPGHPGTGRAYGHIPMKNQNDLNADRRRAGLRALMRSKGINPTSLANRAGLTGPNALFNFLNGRTQSLSLELIERILQAFPEASFRELVGLKSRSPTGVRHDPGGALALRVFVSVKTSGDAWLPQFELPPDLWATFLVPDHVAADTGELFGVRVREPGAELLSPDGTVLICRRLRGESFEPVAGCRYVVQERRAKSCRVTVQEARIFEGQVWLWPCSSHPRHQTPTLLARNCVETTPSSRHPMISLEGLVIGSWQPDTLPSYP